MIILRKEGENMKLLKIEIKNSSIFNNEFELSFINKSRIVETDVNTSVDVIRQGIGTLNINAVAGVNAAGKTSTLRLVDFILNVFGRRQSLDTNNVFEFLSDIYNGSPLTFVSYWLINSSIFKLKSIIDSDDNGRFVFTDESFTNKNLTSTINKRTVFKFTGKEEVIDRNNLPDEIKKFFTDKVSIFVSDEKEIVVSARLSKIDINYCIVQPDLEITRLVLSLLDPNIEYIKQSDINRELLILKFKGREEIAVDNKRINEILSSGTVKGIDLMVAMLHVIKNGGYLLLDEIENHLHLSIVKKILRMFEDRHINKKNATIMFSTHYAEILDVLDRNDSINIVSSYDNGIICKNLTEYNFRNKNDFIRKNLFESGKLNTTPNYESVRALEKYFVGVHDEK